MIWAAIVAAALFLVLSFVFKEKQAVLLGVSVTFVIIAVALIVWHTLPK